MTTLEPLRAFNDNYIWLYDNGAGRGFVVDPGDPGPVRAALDSRGLVLDAILVTHHHFDHVGGVDALKAETGCTVYGPDNTALPFTDRRLGDGDRLTVLGLAFEVLAVPGHTLDHIAYFSPAPTPVLFCGDTLFAGGCGRLFEGTPAMMHASLQRLAALPEDTAVYCAHEYTEANLAFASAAEPGNEALATRVEQVRSLRERDEPTLPSSLALERRTNPFLRPDAEGILAGLCAAGQTPAEDSIGRFAQLRAWKDNF
ncbi:hydroxyacylglutathione hydrolase [Pseudohaliea rubra]|uniref:Hydroxyacylglutathione hydrolase n=1 Tax=Pseudohaliea rubra DSM 19751 TaxID=1265313 RepID=A0A095VR32_9GAMM|nr:hydroxyacylglutathione hydrolase [Pseudohaliea rubra]KGE03548.1 Hydroxyacylglutathione hydrolase [Pseudohaliea rubra DSM 19751]